MTTLYLDAATKKTRPFNTRARGDLWDFFRTVPNVLRARSKKKNMCVKIAHTWVGWHMTLNIAALNAFISRNNNIIIMFDSMCGACGLTLIYQHLGIWLWWLCLVCFWYSKLASAMSQSNFNRSMRRWYV